MTNAKRSKPAVDTWRPDQMRQALRRLLADGGGMLETVVIEDPDRLQANAESGNGWAKIMLARMSDLLLKIRIGDSGRLVCCPRFESPILGKAFTVALVGAARQRSSAGLSMVFCTTCAPDCVFR